MSNLTFPVPTSPITLLRVCRACRVDPEFVIEMVKVGIVRPVGERPVEWRFAAGQQQRLETAAHLSRRYAMNAEGVAFALALLDANLALREALDSP